MGKKDKGDEGLCYDSHGGVHSSREKALEADAGYDDTSGVERVVEEKDEDPE